MGRIRTIKPEFHAHEELSRLSPEAHLLAAALTNYADDEGYFNANPGLVKAGTHPLRKDKASTEAMLADLAKVEYIEIRRCADGKAIGLVVTFKIHQKVSHPTPSKMHQRFLEGSRILPEDYGKLHETLRPEQGTGNGREQGTGNREASTAGAVPAARGKLLGTLPLNDRTEYEVREDDLARDGPLYPGVDVPQAYRGMKAYLLANPAKLKTRSGIRKFMNNWLARAQNDGGRNSGAYRSNQSKGANRVDEALDELRKAGVEVPAGRDQVGAGEVRPAEGGGDGCGTPGVVLEGTR